jgi:hypothetical protein
MRLRLEQDLEDLRAAVDKQAARTVAPLARTVDRDQCFSPELWAAVRDLGPDPVAVRGAARRRRDRTLARSPRVRNRTATAGC